MGYGLLLEGRSAGGGIIPLVGGCTAGAMDDGAGECVDRLSPFTAGGEPEFVLLPGLTSDAERTIPLAAGVVRGPSA